MVLIGSFQLQNLAAHVDLIFLERSPLATAIVTPRCAHLGGQVARHLVDGLGQLFPHARHAFDLRLAAELAFGATSRGPRASLQK